MLPNKILFYVLAITALSSCAFAGVVGTSYVHVPAVISNENSGTLTTFNLTITGSGTGSINIKGPQYVGNDTLQSARTAVDYASSYVGVNESMYNFTYTISDIGTNVSGPSAGLAFTLLAISAFQHRQLENNFTLTGTISPNGAVGPVGGVYDKASTAKANGMKFIIVPTSPTFAASSLTLYGYIYYIINKSVGIPVVEVSNVSQALPYAYGEIAPHPLFIPQLPVYDTSGLNSSNLSCTTCIGSYFKQVVQMMFNSSQSEINILPNSYSNIKSVMDIALENYTSILDKGYTYTSADQAFLIYINAFMLANHNDFNATSAYSTIENVSSYCNSISPPQMTNTNYELVVGGEVRQAWANETINATLAAFNSSGDSDQMLASVSQVAPAMGWCIAASDMYGAAYAMNGTSVGTSPSLTSQAKSALLADKSIGPNQYTIAAQQDFNQGMYAASLYNSAYASAFASNQGPKYNTSQSIQQISNITEQYIANATSGLWPDQFALSAKFYLYQASIANSTINKQNYLASAMSVAKLASSLNSANNDITSSFVNVQPQSNAQLQASLGNIENQINDIVNQINLIYIVLIAIAVILIAVLVCLLYLIIKSSPGKSQKLMQKPQKKKR